MTTKNKMIPVDGEYRSYKEVEHLGREYVIEPDDRLEQMSASERAAGRLRSFGFSKVIASAESIALDVSVETEGYEEVIDIHVILAVLDEGFAVSKVEKTSGCISIYFSPIWNMESSISFDTSEWH